MKGGRPIKICPKDRTEYGDDISFCPLCGTRVVSVGLRKGEVIGGSYRIVELIGRGWAGAVYRAEHSMMGRPTALKIVQSPVVADPAFIERFRQAAHLLSDLDSPEVAMVHDLGIEQPNRIFIASELVEGKSLARILSEEGPMAAQNCLSIIRSVLEGLKRAHSMDVVHGSLKPSNVIVPAAQPDEGRIVDFGARRIVAALQDELFAVSTPYGLVYGELPYMAPEQITGEGSDPRTDAYAVGLLMYELLTGARPFRQEDPAALAQAQVEEKPVAPREFKPQLRIPKFMEKAVMQALEKKPRRRQQTVGEFLEQLQAEIVPEEEEPRGMWARARAAVGPRPPAREEAAEKPAAPAAKETPPAAEVPPPPPAPEPSPEDMEPLTVMPEEEGLNAALAAMGGSASPAAQDKRLAHAKGAPPAKTAAAPRKPGAAPPAEAPEEAKPAATKGGVVEPEGPRLLLYDGKKLKAAWALEKPEMTVGRSPECDIHIDDRTVSRVHATIYVRPDGVVVKDKVSLNGTYVNDDVVTGKAHVEDGDLVSFGDVGLVFRNA